jgi:putative inorganic carbon (hco3(-)) transporter
VLFASLRLTGVGSFVSRTGSRYNGFMVDPNGYCGYLTCLSIFQLWFLLNRPKGTHRSRFLQWLNVVFLLAGCALTTSRSGSIALLGGVICFGLFMTLRRAMLLAMILLPAILFGGLLIVRLANLQEIEDRSSSRTTVEARMVLNQKGWEMYTEGPSSILAGIGIGRFEDASEANFQLDAQIHNTFFWLLVEGGPLICGVFALMLCRAQWQNYCVGKGKSAHLTDIAIASFCAIGGFVAWSLGIEGMFHRHFWVLLAFSDLCFAYCPALRPFAVTLPGRAINPICEMVK